MKTLKEVSAIVVFVLVVGYVLFNSFAGAI